MGLKVKLLMVLEMDNKGTTDSCNTTHVDVQQCFLWELTESKVMNICWIKGSENIADAFIKNLDDLALRNALELS